jgi:hypothetical protein
MQLLFDNGNQYVNSYGTPDLRLSRIIGVADKPLDTQRKLGTSDTAVYAGLSDLLAIGNHNFHNMDVRSFDAPTGEPN